MFQHFELLMGFHMQKVIVESAGDKVDTKFKFMKENAIHSKNPEAIGGSYRTCYVCREKQNTPDGWCISVASGLL